MKREEYQRIRADVAKKYKEEIHVLKMKNQKLLHEIFERYLNAI